LKPLKPELINTAWAMNFTKTLNDLGFIAIKMYTNTTLIGGADEALVPIPISQDLTHCTYYSKWL